jgi:hypothetical protein
LAPVADIVDEQNGPVSDGLPNPGFSTPSSEAASELQAQMTTPNNVPLFHQEALIEMAMEVYRLAREFRRRVNAEDLLPALTTLSALAPLHELLTQQMAARLMTESTVTPTPHQQIETSGTSPAGYL